jgi:outer membrane protein
MRHNIQRFVSISCLLFASSFAGAAIPNSPIATINARKILSDSRVAKEALIKFQMDFQPKEKELQGLASALKSKSAELEKTAPGLAPSVRSAKQNELDELNRELKIKQQQFIEDRDARKRDDIQHVFNVATQAVKRVAEGARIEMVFQNLVYTNPQIDITDKVIAAMDADADK